MTVHLIALSHGKANAIDGDLVSFLSRELDVAVESGKTAVIEKTRNEARRLFLDSWFSPEVVERRKAMLAR